MPAKKDQTTPLLPKEGKKKNKKKGQKVEEIIIQEKEEELEMENPLPEDIYSLIYTSEYHSWAFFYGLLVFGVQITIILMILNDLVDLSDSNNPLQVAPGVSLEVTIAQAISTVLAVVTQTNLLTALSRASEGYDPDINMAVNPSCTWRKFTLTVRLQFLVGILYLADSFILNMQSASVLELMMNFAALAFISDIQDLAFWLAHHGFLSETIQNETYQVEKYEIPVQHVKRKVAKKRLLFGIICTILLSLYSVVVHQQRSGKFLCKKIFVQFGDAYRPELPYFSGEYLQGSHLVNGRVVYVDPKGRSKARFAYCNKEHAWTFSGGLYPATIDPDAGVLEFKETSDPCEYWVKSTETRTYDITETTSWMIFKFVTKETLPLESFTLNCNDCDSHGSTSCSGHGACVNNQCVCNPGRSGHSCEYWKHCSNLELDERTLPFPYSNAGVFRPSNSYELLLEKDAASENSTRPVLVYNKPVYFAEVPSQPDILNIILFTGRRWCIVLNVELTDTELQSKENLPRYLTTNFHGWFSRFHIYFFSEPIDVGGPSDFSSNPSDLIWYRSRQWLKNGDKVFYQVDDNHPTKTVLLCSDCQSLTNDCFNGGECRKDKHKTAIINSSTTRGECICPLGTSGFLCERELSCYEPGVKCFNGGKCNKQTGDCSCPSTHTGRLCQYGTACTIDPTKDAQSCITGVA